MSKDTLTRRDVLRKFDCQLTPQTRSKARQLATKLGSGKENSPGKQGAKALHRVLRAAVEAETQKDLDRRTITERYKDTKDPKKKKKRAGTVCRSFGIPVPAAQKPTAFQPLVLIGPKVDLFPRLPADPRVLQLCQRALQLVANAHHQSDILDSPVEPGGVTPLLLTDKPWSEIRPRLDNLDPPVKPEGVEEVPHKTACCDWRTIASLAILVVFGFALPALVGLAQAVWTRSNSKLSSGNFLFWKGVTTDSSRLPSPQQ